MAIHSYAEAADGLYGVWIGKIPIDDFLECFWRGPCSRLSRASFRCGLECVCLFVGHVSSACFKQLF